MISTVRFCEMTKISAVEYEA